MKQTDEINQKIIQYLGEGLTYKEISARVFKSIVAIRKRIKKMRTEVGAKNNTELIKKVSQVIPA